MIPVNEPVLDGNELKYLTECIKTGWISSEGPFVLKFEQLLARRVGRAHGIAVANGSVALDVAVAAVGVGPGDEVIMPTFTIISCAAAVVRAGAKPVLVDSDPVTWNMDVAQIRAKITPRTKAIMVVHIYGLPVDMDPLLALAKEHGLRVIEDAAEMHGQTYKGRPCGSFGDVSVFSFYPNKHITTGEGGMVVTDDPEIAARCSSLRNLCFNKERRFVHDELGWNFRMTNLQAALGLAQLERLDEFVGRKRAMGRLYTELLRDVPGIQLPLAHTDYADNIYWVYGIVLANGVAESVTSRLTASGIGTRPFFWCMHEQPVFRKMGWYENEAYPVAEAMARRGFYVPSGLALTEKQIRTVAEGLRRGVSMTTFGDLYTRCYDLLYRDKNYGDEARYVAELLREHANAPKSLLELGCGTGRYTQEFLRMGYAVHGVDLSPEMLDVARDRCGGQAELAVADISQLALGKRFDAVVALFHVADYLTSNEQLDGLFASTKEHLVPGGIFIFDFWYGPAVLSDRPSVRVKRVEDDVISVLRITEPVLRPNEDIVEVHFDNRISVRQTNEQLEQRETHRMRYLFLPEIDGWLAAHGFARVAAHRWMTRESLGVDSWYGIVVARKSRGE